MVQKYGANILQMSALVERERPAPPILKRFELVVFTLLGRSIKYSQLLADAETPAQPQRHQPGHADTGQHSQNRRTE